MNIFETYTRLRYQTNQKLLSFKPVPPLASTFKERMLGEKEEVPDIDNLALGQLIKEVFSFQAYYPNHPYSLRKRTASARSIHPFFPVIYYKGYSYLYDSLSNRFIYFAYDRKKREEIKVCLYLDIWRICAVYGEFGLPLSLLELGHILSDLKWLVQDNQLLSMEEEKLTFTAYQSTDLDQAKDLYQLAALSFIDKEKGEIARKRQTKTRLQKKYNYQKEVEQLPILEELKAIKASQLRRIGSYGRKLEGLLAKRKDRHSLNQRMGTFPLGPALSVKFLRTYLQEVSHYIKEWAFDEVGFYLLSLHIDGLAKGIYKWDGKNLMMIEEDVDPYSIFYEGREGINIERLPFLILLSVKINQPETREAFVESHIHIGEIVHTMSLLFAGEDRFSRPFKNINDSYVEGICQTDPEEHFIYACMFGSGRRQAGIPWR